MIPSNEPKMPHNIWANIINTFKSLGGIAENIDLKKGRHGRGIFPQDSAQKSLIVTPENILIKSDSVQINDRNISILPSSGIGKKEREFAELYYNELSWGSDGNQDAKAFLKYITTLPMPIKNALANNKFIDKRMSNYLDNDQTLLERFIDERAFRFKGQSVLAPLLELVNHSNFAPPFRVTNTGLETPPAIPKDAEILHKYSGKNSAMSLWRSYGFSAKSIISYSIPFEITVKQYSTVIRCFGQQEAESNDIDCKQITSGLISISSLPVGCQLSKLPLLHLSSILSTTGIDKETTRNLMIFIQKLNIERRVELTKALQEHDQNSESELSKALELEIQLIQTSLNATESSRPEKHSW
ncbi:hypothetical protein [Synechococcus sp. MIT S9508]|uniref:hypothetical protein n=1 Tax=Synechococcus sp. MIT S9508 TaxID=1801629 RepID=UPI0007BC7E56|nr:hypothetical protein [Synechococcus sp. MIT S9508]KZR87470.1 hypothetical protein MITS9508_02423 [Synechococcus sp. MIT S9508]